MKTLLIVDDSIFVYEEMKRMLAGTEYEIVAFAKSGEEAVVRYTELKPDLVTMDIILPGIDGLDTAKLILDNYPKARIVMVSSLAYDETIEEAGDIGARGFAYKPFEKEQFLEVLAKAFEEE